MVYATKISEHPNLLSKVSCTLYYIQQKRQKEACKSEYNLPFQGNFPLPETSEALTEGPAVYTRTQHKAYKKLHVPRIDQPVVDQSADQSGILPVMGVPVQSMRRSITINCTNNLLALQNYISNAVPIL